MNKDNQNKEPKEETTENAEGKKKELSVDDLQQVSGGLAAGGKVEGGWHVKSAE